MDQYICDHCNIEFGCAPGQPIICLQCGKEQTPPAYRLQPVEHAIIGQPETAVRKTKPFARGLFRRGRKK